MKTDRSRVLLALGSLYVIWGSTFLGIRIALEGYPPLMLAGLRFAIAGGVTYAWVRARGVPPPTRTQWRSSLIVGTLLTCANACVVIAEQWVSSGVAAVAIASVPLWVALIAGLFGRWPSGGEWLGLRVQRVPVPALPGAAHARRKLRLRQSGGRGRPWRGGSRREHRAARGGSARADSRWRRHAGDPSPGRVAARKGRAYLWGMSVRVAHLIYGLWLGGLEQLVVHLASRSRARGIDSCIVGLGEDGPIRPLAQEQGIDVEVLPVDGMSVSALLGIRRALEKHGATVLHAHDLGPWLNAVAVRVL